jgi:prepilin peptidase CpaA
VFNFVISAIFPALVIVAALRDTTTMTIPNGLCAIGVALFVPVIFAAGLSPVAAGAAVAVGLAALVAGVAMFAAGWIGGGDVKFFAVCGLWLGWKEALPFVVWTAIAGGALAVALLGLRKLVLAFPRNGPGWWNRLMTPGGDVPYGVAIALGALVTFPESPVIQALQMTR